MKVVALGGSGDMGRVAVRTLLQNKAIEHVIVADNDAQRLNSFVESLGTARASARVLDIGDEAELVSLMRQGDVIINTSGPFYQYGVAVVQAAIKAQRNCADICDDWKPTQDLLALDDSARAAGISVVVGIGASPGLSNLLVKHAANHLDRVDAVHTAWGVVGGPPLALLQGLQGESNEQSSRRIAAAMVHWLYSCSGTVPTFRHGKFEYITPLEEGEEMTFSTGRGKFYHIGHPEPVTLPRFIEGVKHACNVFGGGPEVLATLRSLGQRITSGEITPPQAAEMFPEELRYRLPQQPEPDEKRGPIVGGLLGSAEGTKGGKRMRYGYEFTGGPAGGMAGDTGVPLAIAAEMLLEGAITARGVLAPEACIDPMPFFERYSKYWRTPPREGQILSEVVEELG